jgi:predicted Zn-dependent protease
MEKPAYRLLERFRVRSPLAELEPHDSWQVEAALAWLELGNPREAKSELALLGPECGENAQVLRARYLTHEAAAEWEEAAEVARTICKIFPSRSYGWNQLAYALHQLHRTREAYDVLLPVADKFAAEDSIPYNLACYACRLGQEEEAWGWLLKSVELAGAEEIKAQALNDTDLEPLWPRVAELKG